MSSPVFTRFATEFTPVIGRVIRQRIPGTPENMARIARDPSWDTLKATVKDTAEFMRQTANGEIPESETLFNAYAKTIAEIYRKESPSKAIGTVMRDIREIIAEILNKGRTLFDDALKPKPPEA